MKDKFEELMSKVKTLNGVLIGASKKIESQKIEEAYNLGLQDFGENYVSEALLKMRELKGLDIRWHFFGRVQSGNLNKITNSFYLIHSLCKFEHLEKINKNTVAPQKILLQVRHSSDLRGFGLSEMDLVEVLKKEGLLEKLDFSGLMFMPPSDLEGEDLENAFKWARELFESCKPRVTTLKNSWDCLSMGMSGDYLKALKCGSTHVRLGTVVFGKREI